MSICPTCGQGQVRKSIIRDDAEALALLNGDPRRYFYLSISNVWGVTHTPNTCVSHSVVQSLINKQLIVRVYSDCDEAYGLDATLDVIATEQARRKNKSKEIIYFNNSKRGVSA